MAKKHKPPRSRVREKAARAPRPQLARFERAIEKYRDEVRTHKGETARFHCFSNLLNELFGELDLPVVRDFLAGLETQLSAYEAEKCRVLRGRADALYGNLVIEFESSFPAKLKEAKGQLQRYLAILRKSPETSETYFIPIATDGVSFHVFAPKPGVALSPEQVQEEIEIEQVEDFDLTKRQPVEFYYWLDRYFLRREKRKPRTPHFVEDFGPNSPAFREACSLWLDVAVKIREHSDFKVIYENWQKYLRLAYGTEVGDVSLFIRHTYLATLAKLVAYVRIGGAETPPEPYEVETIVRGTYFEQKGINNFLEEDFFSWVAREHALSTTQHVTARLANLLFTYNLRELSEDVLKELYQSLVDPKDRHDLGEYYTPDWLARAMCEALLGQTGKETVLDPACGSGTFLYQTIQHKRRHLPVTRQSLERILGSVVGIDIHPLAVIVSKINVLLALGDLFLKREKPLSVQVYLANAIRHPEKNRFMGHGGLPAERVVLNEREVLIPDAVLSSPSLLDAAVHVADEFAKSNQNNPSLDLEAFMNYARREAPEIASSTDVLQMLFRLAALMHEFIRKPEDTIWAYILKNQYKPTFLAGQFDVLIGNPPWLSFRFVERGDYQNYLKNLIVNDCKLLSGAGHLITHLELGTLFFVRCSRLYLRPSGKIGFVLPRSIFTADQHDRFRKSSASGNVTLTAVWDLDKVSPLFSVPAAVAFGDLQTEAKKILPGEIVSGELPRKNADWEEAKSSLHWEKSEFHVVDQGKRSYLSTSRKRISGQRSYYQPFFKEGATLVPRNFWFVEFKTDPKLGIDPKQPLVTTDPRAEAEAKVPYKGTRLEGPIESEFLFATLLSTDLLPFGHFDFRPVVLPLAEDSHGYELLSVEKARDRGFLRIAAWLERAQEQWVIGRKEKASKIDVLSWLNYRNKLTDQDPKAKFVVIYPKSATFLCAAVVRSKGLVQKVGTQSISLQRFLADYVTFFWETDDRLEAHYVTSVLNSKTIDDLIKPMQARGLWGPRDITKKVWELPIPRYQADKPEHTRLVEIGLGAEKKVMQMLPDVRDEGSIGRARSVVRHALVKEIAEIDSLVRKILK
jgi:hypothetical protein